MVGWQQGDDEPHLAKERHGPSTTQNTMQRMCPIVRLHFPLCGTNDTRLHPTRSRHRAPRVRSKDAKLGSPPPPASGSDSPHITLCGASEHPLHDL
eukprot:gene11383-biopygen21401